MTEQSFNIYELIAWFWAESEERSVTPTEAALYSFLLARANVGEGFITISAALDIAQTSFSSALACTRFPHIGSA